MSNGKMKPCADPSVCGVQNHYDGTLCRARGGGLAGLPGKSRKLAPGAKDGVKATVSLGGSTEKGKVDMPESEHDESSGWTFAEVDAADFGKADVEPHDFEADSEGNWSAETQINSLAYSYLSGEAMDAIPEGAYEEFLQARYPESDIGIDSFGDVQVHTNEEDADGVINPDRVNAKFRETHKRLLDDIENDRIDYALVEHGQKQEEEEERQNVDEVIEKFEEELEETINAPVSDTAVEAPIKNPDGGLGRTISEAGIKTHYDFEGEDPDSKGYANKYMLWLSRTDENGEEKSLGFPMSRGVALSPEPNAEEAVSAILSDENYQEFMDEAPISRKEEWDAERFGLEDPNAEGDRLTWKQDKSITATSERFHEVVGEHYDDLHTDWEESDWR